MLSVIVLAYSTRRFTIPFLVGEKNVEVVKTLSQLNKQPHITRQDIVTSEKPLWVPIIIILVCLTDNAYFEALEYKFLGVLVYRHST